MAAKASSLHVTMQMIADEAHVSRATVSRVLSNPSQVDPATQSRVMAVVKRLGYIRNAVATQLAGQSSDTVGFLLRDTINPSYAYLHDTLLNTAHEYGLFVLTMSAGRMHKHGGESLRLERLMAHRPAGLLIGTGLIATEEIVPFAAQVPTVVFPRPELSQQLCNVAYDEVAHGRMIAQAVINKGHTKVAVAVSSVKMSYVEHLRATTMLETLEAAGVKAVALRGRDLLDNHVMLANKIAQGCRQGRYTAVMFPNDSRALKFLLLAEKLGLRVPDDIAVTGVDGLGLATQISHLTSIRVPVESVCEAAIKMMVSMLHRDDVLHAKGAGPAGDDEGSGALKAGGAGAGGVTNAGYVDGGATGRSRDSDVDSVVGVVAAGVVAAGGAGQLLGNSQAYDNRQDGRVVLGGSVVGGSAAGATPFDGSVSGSTVAGSSYTDRLAPSLHARYDAGANGVNAISERTHLRGDSDDVSQSTSLTSPFPVIQRKFIGTFLEGATL